MLKIKKIKQINSVVTHVSGKLHSFFFVIFSMRMQKYFSESLLDLKKSMRKLSVILMRFFEFLVTRLNFGQNCGIWHANLKFS